jgi:Ca2+-binding RTX toxin-like protein
LTENNGSFTFAAQVRLDFNAVDGAGNLIWNPRDLLFDLEILQDLDRAPDAGGLSGLLPPEGDFLAIIIDALGGNDRIFVGPTVQKTVWIDAGSGDDFVFIRSGNAILPDRTEQLARNDLPGNASSLNPPSSTAATAISANTTFAGLTLDNPEDQDFYRIEFRVNPSGLITASSLSVNDGLVLELYDITGETLLRSSALAPDVALSLDDAVDQAELEPFTVYLLRVRSDRVPTVYSLDFLIDAGGLTTVVDLSAHFDAVRRDVLMGGSNNDTLQGGAGQDWIFGGPGNDVLSGGIDRQEEDLLFGEAGDDRFQIIPDLLPFIPGTQQTQLPTLTDRFDGGVGFDEVIFLGGDLDAAGRAVPDFVALKYNPQLHRYEFTALVWDTANQQFMPDPNRAGAQLQAYQFFQTHGVERMLIDTLAGDDEVRADPGYAFPNTTETWGIREGAVEQNGVLAPLTIRGGPGHDRIFGGAYGDDIDGGAGEDFILGGGGDDRIVGGDGDDVIQGDGQSTPLDLNTTLPDRYEFGTANGVTAHNDDFRFASMLSGVGPGQTIAGLSFHLGDTEDWYVIPTPASLLQYALANRAYLSADMISVVFASAPIPAFNPQTDMFLFAARDIDQGPGVAVQPVDLFEGVPEYYMLLIRNPLDPLPGANGLDGPRAPAGVYEIRFDDRVGKTIDVPAQDTDDLAIGSVNLANQPAVIPLGNFLGATTPPLSVFPDFVAAIREDLTLQESIAYLVVGGSLTGELVIDDSTTALKLPGLLLSAEGTRRAFLASPGDYNGDGRDDIAVAITRLAGAGPVAREAVYILFGRPTPWVGLLDLVGNADVVITGLTGAASVDNAGDVNGDAIDDLIIGEQGGNFAAILFGRSSAAWALASGSVFTADFSNGGAPNLDGFVIDNALPVDPAPGQVPGLWHLTTRRSGDPGHTSPDSLYFGLEGAGNYNVGHTAGSLTSPAISLAGLSGAELSFNHFLKTESSTSFDRAEVQISANGGAFTTVLSRGNGLLANTTSWANVTFNLQSFIGQSIRIRFVFNTVDSAGNTFEGWYLDDVVVRSFLSVTNPSVKLSGPAGTAVSVAGVGDISGDGRDDFAILRQGTGNNGRVSLVFGRAFADPFPATSTVDLVTGATLTTTDFDFTGFKVLAAGNLDGDTRQDVLISGESVSYAVLGSALTGSVELTNVGLLIPVGGVVGLGRINSDSFSDLGVSVIERSPTLGSESSTRRHQVAWVYFGGLAPALDFGTPALVFEPARADYISGSRLRPHAFAAIGDLNQDGRGDFALAERIGTQTRVFFGRDLIAPPPAPATPATPEPFVYDLAPPRLPGTAPSSTIFVLPGSTAEPVRVTGAARIEGTYEGESLAEWYPIGDFNGDGFEDVLIRGLGFFTPGSMRLLYGPVNVRQIRSADEMGDVVFDTTTLSDADGRH